tara:strand:+ start:878 stop:1132 length:255 start_codon:yes stop_codon:yes gene_type:complete
MARPRKHIIVTASQIEEAFTNGRVTVPMLAAKAGVSVPTMRRHLAETFGDRMIFRRGRTGGLTLTPATPEAEADTAPTAETLAS